MISLGFGLPEINESSTEFPGSETDIAIIFARSGCTSISPEVIKQTLTLRSFAIISVLIENHPSKAYRHRLVVDLFCNYIVFDILGESWFHTTYIWTTQT